MQRPEHLNNKARRAAGFSLVEILLSLGIFAIGMTAIVSLFPAAAILQRETTQEVISEMAAQSAKAIIETNELTYTATANSNVIAIASLYPAADRSYPTAQVNNTNIADCDMHWVPFLQNITGDAANPVWVVRLFILEADSRANYNGTPPAGSTAVNPATDPDNFPHVVSLAASRNTGNAKIFNASTTGLEPGDIVMDNNGNSHTVVDTTASTVEVLNTIPQVPQNISTLYYAPPFGGSSSPAMRIVTVEVDVVAP